MRQLGLAPGQLSILTACAPCQSYSTLSAKTRRKAGVNGKTRTALVERIATFARAMRPAAVVAENVPQLAKEPGFHRLVRRLRRSQYGVWWGVVNAADFGVPQNRRRLVVIALRGVPDADVPGVAVDHPTLKPYATRTTVGAAFASLARTVAGDDPLNTPRTDYPPLVLERIKSIPKNGGSRSDLPVGLRLDCHKKLEAGGGSGAGNVYGRMSLDDVAPTMTTRCVTPACGRFLHPSEDRAITLREAAWLQTFPADYRFVGGTIAIQAQIGNAVPARLAEIIGRLLTDTLGGARPLDWPELGC
jgi:DNA (cytosine-5)-methyltransferase 1